MTRRVRTAPRPKRERATEIFRLAVDMAGLKPDSVQFSHGGWTAVAVFKDVEPMSTVLRMAQSIPNTVITYARGSKCRHTIEIQFKFTRG